MIYDCFTFFNELDLLEIRLNVLDSVVDKFVLVEMGLTHTGKSKPFYYDDNKGRFDKFLNKIVHIKLDNCPDLQLCNEDANGNKWLLENYQRDMIKLGISECEYSDTIMISDLDEIPNPAVIKKYEGVPGVKKFLMPLFYYYVNFAATASDTDTFRMLSYKDYLNCLDNVPVEERFKFRLLPEYWDGTNPNKIRCYKGDVTVPNSGWHFSYCGGVDAIIEKRESIVEQQYNNKVTMNPVFINKVIESGGDIYRRNYEYFSIELNDSFPEYILKNQDKYQHLIFKTTENGSLKQKEKFSLYQTPMLHIGDPRKKIISWVTIEDAKVLDVGCACGDLACELKNVWNCQIYGLEKNFEAVEISKGLKVFQEVFHEDLNTLDINKYDKYNNYFDYIIFGDVLEHIPDQTKILNMFKKLLNKDGFFLISIPNTAHASIKASLLLDSFDYTQTGLLDQTHIRFFTYKSIAKLLEEAQLEIVDIKFTNWAGIKGTQAWDPYQYLPKSIQRFIFEDPHSYVCQYVFQARVSLTPEKLYEKNILQLNRSIEQLASETYNIDNLKLGIIEKVKQKDGQKEVYISGVKFHSFIKRTCTYFKQLFSKKKHY